MRGIDADDHAEDIDRIIHGAFDAEVMGEGEDQIGAGISDPNLGATAFEGINDHPAGGGINLDELAVVHEELVYGLQAGLQIVDILFAAGLGKVTEEIKT